MNLKSRLLTRLFLLMLFGIGFTSCSDKGDLSVDFISESTAHPSKTKEVTASRAQDIARIFSTERFGISPTAASRSSQSIETITGADGTALAHVINTDGAGWVIVSALRTYYPILAYSDKPGDTFLHMNWGWGGEHNGNFITPTPGEYNFSSNRECTLVSPNK